MNLSEFQRLRGYMTAARNAPYASHIGRRAAKGKAMHYGSVLKYSRVMSQSMEKQPFQRPKNGSKGY